jgi:hypothetical protein
MTNAPSSQILVTLVTVAAGSSKMAVLTRATMHNIREDGILHSHCHEKFNVTGYNSIKNKNNDLLADSNILNS